ncbi:MAG: gliding motility-associated C-terminal domain-containing protein [Bacteroidota bacterium]
MQLSRTSTVLLLLCLSLSSLYGGNPSFSPLAGPSHLIAPDTTSCPGDFEIDLGFDLEIDLGDSIFLTVLSNRPLDGTELWVWNDPENLSCTNCPSTIYSPTDSTLLMLSITDDDGCIASDEIFIYVDRKEDIYVPNAFTPNFDGVNDRLSVYTGDGIKLVKSMQIFSRKGDLIFEANNFPGNDSSFGWNGRLDGNGNEHNAGAYVYLLEVELIDGTLRQQTGVINLIR